MQKQNSMAKRMFLIQKKLWSSAMIFNNGHEDCKKLTPEIVNTQSGKYLHQFEWTNAISEIPEWFVYTEGHAYTDKVWRPLAIHYTRGGLGLMIWIHLKYNTKYLRKTIE